MRGATRGYAEVVQVKCLGQSRMGAVMSYAETTTDVQHGRNNLSMDGAGGEQMMWRVARTDGSR